jgi:hypothetical protein
MHHSIATCMMQFRLSDSQIDFLSVLHDIKTVLVVVSMKGLLQSVPADCVDRRHANVAIIFGVVKLKSFLKRGIFYSPAQTRIHQRLSSRPTRGIYLGNYEFNSSGIPAEKTDCVERIAVGMGLGL